MRRTNPTYKQFAAKHGITMDCELGEHRAGWPAGSSHWRCTLKMGRRRMTVPFSMGPAHTGSPQLDAVLNSLALDASMYENTGSAEELASELGYDDMRQARKVWSALRSQTERLKKFLDDEQYEELLYETHEEGFEPNPHAAGLPGPGYYWTGRYTVFRGDRAVGQLSPYRSNPERGGNPRGQMTKKQFEEYFKTEVLPYIGNDKPARRQAWNDTVDAFIRDGLLPESAGDWTHPRWLETRKVKW